MMILRNPMLQRLVWVTTSLIALSLRAAPVEILFPPEVAVFKQDAGVEIANAQCLICHSVEYVTIQPPLPKTFWKGSIQKMQQKYGAPIPEDQVEPLADYLTRNYGAATNNPSKAATGDQQPQVADHSAESAPPP